MKLSDKIIGLRKSNGMSQEDLAEKLDVSRQANVNAAPDMFVNTNGLTFTRRVLEEMGYPQHVVCQIDVKNRVFAIRGCKSNELKAFKFSKPKEEQKATVTINNKNVLEPIRKCMAGKWQADKRYKVTGFFVSEAKTMCFALEEGVQEDYRVNGTDGKEE